MKVFLFFVCVALAAVVYAEWALLIENGSLPDIRAATPPDGGHMADKPELAAAFPLPPVQELEDVLERPLFVATRRRPEKIEEEASEPAPEVSADPFPPHLRLTAIWSSGQANTALFQDAKAKEMKRLKAGDEFESWILKEIKRDRVLLTRNGLVEEIELWKFDKPPVQPQNGKINPRQPPVRRPVRRAPPRKPDNKARFGP